MRIEVLNHVANNKMESMEKKKDPLPEERRGERKEFLVVAHFSSVAFFLPSCSFASCRLYTLSYTSLASSLLSVCLSASRLHLFCVFPFFPPPSFFLRLLCIFLNQFFLSTSSVFVPHAVFSLPFFATSHLVLLCLFPQNRKFMVHSLQRN